MMTLSIKALLGASVVIIISLLAHMKNYYLAGLVPLFPTFALIAHYIIGSERTHDELKNTILFSLCGMIPLLVYLVAIYMLVDLMPLKWALVCASALWCLSAALLLVLWMKFETSIV
ncbi:GlpM family protein [Nitrosospira sp. NRS527]|uniref:GlpM family protein n=1 Tax=Nitrosospira sp. NRS527 TaxID=155925 RepID=UPI001AF38A3A|nr:GlpM family protein [Nitrosospira sp. NRS527]BCT66797.1 Inner membrane protein YdgC [Nitrosospira sp. NRS527]